LLLYYFLLLLVPLSHRFETKDNKLKRRFRLQERRSQQQTLEVRDIDWGAFQMKIEATHQQV
jgi:hypothetical protein